MRSPASELRSVEEPQRPAEQGTTESVPRLAKVQPRVLAALTLILAGVVWAAIRGLEFYGLSPVNVIYDVDQPPLLLIAVAVWLLYRSRRR